MDRDVNAAVNLMNEGKETLSILRDRDNNGNKIGENITIIQRKSRYGLYIHRTPDFNITAERMS